MKQNVIYIIFTSLLFISIAVVFNFFPRSKVSELEKRELNTFPPFSWNSLLSGSFTNDVSIWYSDSEPFRGTRGGKPFDLYTTREIPDIRGYKVRRAPI